VSPTHSYGVLLVVSQSSCRVSLCVLRLQLCCLGHLTGLRSLTVVAEINTASGVDLGGLPAKLEELTLVTPRGLWLSAASAHDGCQVRNSNAVRLGLEFIHSRHHSGCRRASAGVLQASFRWH